LKTTHVNPPSPLSGGVENGVEQQAANGMTALRTERGQPMGRGQIGGKFQNC